MATRQRKNSRFSGLIIPTICLGILGYFGTHAYQGNLGVVSRAQMDNQSIDMEFELARLREVKIQLKHKVDLLRDGQIEKDMLDQQARAMLNLVKVDELVINYD